VSLPVSRCSSPCALPRMRCERESDGTVRASSVVGAKAAYGLQGEDASHGANEFVLSVRTHFRLPITRHAGAVRVRT
jgi:hypothetical protein